MDAAYEQPKADDEEQTRLTREAEKRAMRAYEAEKETRRALEREMREKAEDKVSILLTDSFTTNSLAETIRFSTRRVLIFKMREKKRIVGITITSINV